MEYPFKDLLPIDEVLEREGYYRDWTHLDPEVFYSLTQISEYIKTKGYGVDVRLLISQLAEHFGLRVTQITDAMNEFNDLKPKAELSISQSAEALTKSRNALYVANGIDAKATNALDLSESADTLSKSVQEQFNQVVIDGDSSLEAAQARVNTDGVTKATLKERLDDEHTEVIEQFAQTENEIENLTKNPTNYNGPIVTIIDDDAMPDFRTVWNPILNDTGAKITVAVITGRVGTSQSLTLQELKDLQAQGHEIVSHTVNHTVTSDITVQEAESDYPAAKKWMLNNGFEGHDTLVYPGGLHENRIEIKNVARKYYKYAVSTTVGGDYNLSPVDNWRVPRIQGDTKTLEQLKTAVDNAVLNNGWVILMTHSHILQAEGAQKMRDFITYVQGLNVPIMPFGEASKYKGNAVAIGEYEEDGTFIAMDGTGKVGGGLIVRSTSPNSYNMDEPITSYRKNAKTIQTISSTADTFLGVGGILEVFRGHHDSYSYATFKPHNNNAIYQRRCNYFTGEWYNFEDLAKQTYSPGFWTPVLKGSTVAGEHTYLQQEGSYTKFANVVIARFDIRIPVASLDQAMSGNLQIHGLPIARLSGSRALERSAVEYGNLTLGENYTSVCLAAQGGESFLGLYKQGNGVGNNYVKASDLTVGQDVVFRGSITYQVPE